MTYLLHFCQMSYNMPQMECEVCQGVIKRSLKEGSTVAYCVHSMQNIGSHEPYAIQAQCRCHVTVHRDGMWPSLRPVPTAFTGQVAALGYKLCRFKVPTLQDCKCSPADLDRLQVCWTPVVYYTKRVFLAELQGQIASYCFGICKGSHQVAGWQLPAGKRSGMGCNGYFEVGKGHRQQQECCMDYGGDANAAAASTRQVTST